MKTPYLIFVKPIIELIDENEHSISNLEKLSDEKLLKRPSEKSWSVAENIAHLNILGDEYVQQMLNHKEKFSKNNSGKVKSSWFVQFFAKTMLPDNQQKRKFKMKTTSKFEGFDNLNPKEEIEKFKRLQSNMRMVLTEAGVENLSNIKIITALGPLLKFRMGDALYFVIAHNKRHMIQAEKAVESLD